VVASVTFILPPTPLYHAFISRVGALPGSTALLLQHVVF